MRRRKHQIQWRNLCLRLQDIRDTIVGVIIDIILILFPLRICIWTMLPIDIVVGKTFPVTSRKQTNRNDFDLRETITEVLDIGLSLPVSALVELIGLSTLTIPKDALRMNRTAENMSFTTSLTDLLRTIHRVALSVCQVDDMEFLTLSLFLTIGAMSNIASTHSFKGVPLKANVLGIAKRGYLPRSNA